MSSLCIKVGSILKVLNDSLTFQLVRCYARGRPRPHNPFRGVDLVDHDDYNEFEGRGNVESFDSIDETLEFDVNEDFSTTQKGRKRLQEIERKFVKSKILEKQQRKSLPKAANLLTYAAKQQIWFLSSEYPEEWTVDKLCESFPVTRNDMIRLLKNKSMLHASPEEILNHDLRVQKNWLALRDMAKKGENLEDMEGSRPVDVRYRQLVQDNKLPLLANASGVLSLPFPKTQIHPKAKKPKTVQNATLDFENQRAGVFRTIVTGETGQCKKLVQLPAKEDKSRLLLSSKDDKHGPKQLEAPKEGTDSKVLLESVVKSISGIKDEERELKQFPVNVRNRKFQHRSPDLQSSDQNSKQQASG